MGEEHELPPLYSGGKNLTVTSTYNPSIAVLPLARCGTTTGEEQYYPLVQAVLPLGKERYYRTTMVVKILLSGLPPLGKVFAKSPTKYNR